MRQRNCLPLFVIVIGAGCGAIFSGVAFAEDRDSSVTDRATVQVIQVTTDKATDRVSSKSIAGLAKRIPNERRELSVDQTWKSLQARGDVVNQQDRTNW